MVQIKINYGEINPGRIVKKYKGKLNRNKKCESWPTDMFRSLDCLREKLEKEILQYWKNTFLRYWKIFYISSIKHSASKLWFNI